MERWAGRVALVTGASSGIGASVAAELVRKGMKVVGCSRNKDRIQALADELRNAPGSLDAVYCDLSQEADILALFDEIKQRHGRVDVLINYAALGHNEPLLTGDTAKWRNMLDVNVMALLVCTREVFKLMHEQHIDDGHIIHLNSLSAHRVIPNRNSHFHSMTKFAVRAALEGHRNELRELKSNIRVSEISPGVMETEFSRKSGDEYTRSKSTILKPLQPDDITDAVIYTLSTAPHVQVHDIMIRPIEQQH